MTDPIDPQTAADAIVYVARFLIDARENAERTARRLNAAAKAHGMPFDRRADAAEGAQGAYGVCIAAFAGALGRSVEDLAAALPSVNRDMARTMLPGELLGDPGTDPEDADYLRSLVDNAFAAHPPTIQPVTLDPDTIIGTSDDGTNALDSDSADR